jgi:AAHS family 4-hydroxybenzoate transporter-like MFS transporter
VRQAGVAHLLKEGRAPGTVLVWTGMFMNLMIYFFMQKWLTTILIQVGLPQQTAIIATSVGLAGGIIAALIIGPLMDRFGPYAVVAGLFVASALAVSALASVLASQAALLLTGMALLMGFCLSGGQKANNALAVYFYPTALRGTGLGWGLGVGRIGGALGPMLPGYLLAHGWLPADLFYAASVPMLAGAAAITWMGQMYGHDEQRPARHPKTQITP